MLEERGKRMSNYIDGKKKKEEEKEEKKKK